MRPAIKSGRIDFLVIATALIALLLVGCGTQAPTRAPTPRQSAVTQQSTTVMPSSTFLIDPLETTIPAPTSTPKPPTPTDTPTATSPAALVIPDIEQITHNLEGLPIDAFFEESYRQLLLRDPDRLHVKGLAGVFGVPNDRFSNIAPAYLQKTAQLENEIFEILQGYNRDSLSQEQQLSYDVYAWYLEDRIRGHDFMLHNFPVNSLTIWGAQNWLVDFMVNYQPIENLQDAEDYLSRLSEIDTWVEQLIDGLELRAQAGIIPPAYILEASIQQIEDHVQLQGDGRTIPEGTELYNAFLTRLAQADGIDANEKRSLRQAVRDEIETTFIPAFLALRDTLQSQAPVAPADGGAWNLPDGEAYYLYALQHETSTSMTPEEIHELGISELKRIQAEIQSTAADLGFSMDEIDQRLTETSPLVVGSALQKEFELLIEEVDRESREWFNLYPQSELEVKMEPYGSLAYYVPPPYNGSQPGKFFVNLDYPTPAYLMPSLTYHETIPGHHLQGALTRELELPTFRKDLEFNAYIEGWALYAERLTWEEGLYQDDPLGNLGRLQFEEMRALRLVVDTGVHAMGWTIEETSARVRELTGSDVNQEYLTRFYVLPGQASGYTIGFLKILELRQRAMEQLGDAFDLREFHDVILGHGPLPLEILETVVDDYIEAQVDP